MLSAFTYKTKRYSYDSEDLVPIRLQSYSFAHSILFEPTPLALDLNSLNNTF